jgi:polysaccharide deacetylase 2 family uncharacterized protein YibQ
VEVKIGVQNATRELVLDSSDSATDIEKTVAKALAEENGILTLNDAKGRTVLVPIQKLAYVEIGSATTGQVGFRT